MTGQPDANQLSEYERRAPGWVVRCLRCGFTEPWGKYGIRLCAASWMKFTIGCCSHCGRIFFHLIQKRKTE